jgi:hypothetical protein
VWSRISIYCGYHIEDETVELDEVKEGIVRKFGCKSICTWEFANYADKDEVDLLRLTAAETHPVATPVFVGTHTVGYSRVKYFDSITRRTPPTTHQNRGVSVLRSSSGPLSSENQS